MGDHLEILVEVKTHNEKASMLPEKEEVGVKETSHWYPGYCWQRSKETMVNYANELSGK